jgi:hypothetical protein
MKRFLLALALVVAFAASVSANESDNVPATSETVLANDLDCTATRNADVRLVPEGDIIGTIHKGDVLVPIEVKGRWIHTQVNRSLHGWISNKV